MALTEAQKRAIYYKQQKKKQQESKNFLSKEEIKELNNLSIVEYCRNYLDLSLIPVSKTVYSIDKLSIENNENLISFFEKNGIDTDLSSLRINSAKNTWAHYAHGRNGGMIDFVQYIDCSTFGDALKKLQGVKENLSKVDVQAYAKTSVKYRRAPQNTNSVEGVREFLKNERGMSDEIIDSWISHKHVYASKEVTVKLYASDNNTYDFYVNDNKGEPKDLAMNWFKEKHHELEVNKCDVNEKKCIVFPGKQYSDKSYFGTRIYTTPKIEKDEQGNEVKKYEKRDLLGSYKGIGILHNDNPNATKLRVFEAACDCMAWQDMALAKGIDITDSNYLITCGVDTVNSCTVYNIGRHFSNNSIKEVILMLDNDRAGQDAIKDFKNMCQIGEGVGIAPNQKEFIVSTFKDISVNIETSVYKDWNEDLHAYRKGEVAILNNICKRESSVIHPTNVKDMLNSMSTRANARNEGLGRSEIDRSIKAER